MLSLQQVAQGADIINLINTYYRMAEVQGIALGIHGNFIEFYQAEYGRDETLNAILDSGKVPSRWESVCAAADLPSNLSPIYVVIYVSTDPAEFRDQHQVPEVFGQNRYAIYIEYRQPYVATYDRINHRPFMPGGISVSGDGKKTAGTLGGYLKANGTSDEYLLSCYHVLCDGGGTIAVQRGRGDGGTIPTDTVGNISYVVPLYPATGFTFSHPYHCVDVAAALISKTGAKADPVLRILRMVVRYTKPIAQINLGDPVLFIGKESDRRDAKVYRYVARVKWQWNNNVYNFGDVFEIEPLHYTYFGKLAVPGDSGSWVVREKEDRPEQLEAYGVVFGGSGLYALCCFMENVFLELNKVSATTFDYL
jgi:hypothetical protein